jgi:hypothetical protein
MDQGQASPSFELPSPQPEKNGQEFDTQNKGASVEIAAPVKSESLSSASSAPVNNSGAMQAQLPVLPKDQGTLSSSSQNTSNPAAQLASSQLIADDTDLIEKEWVDKAKEIVDRTQDDPYVQNKEINKIKADYIKKRYNKDIKISEE